jgi:hypothetical protein
MPPVTCGAGHSVTYISILGAYDYESNRAATRIPGGASTVSQLIGD